MSLSSEGLCENYQAGLLTYESMLPFTFPRNSSQWYIERSLLTYSGRTARDFNPIPFESLILKIKEPRQLYIQSCIKNIILQIILFFPLSFRIIYLSSHFVNISLVNIIYKSFDPFRCIIYFYQLHRYTFHIINRMRPFHYMHLPYHKGLVLQTYHCCILANHLLHLIHEQSFHPLSEI